MKKWIKAARLRTLPLSLSGIILAAFIAASQQSFEPLIFIFSVLTAVLFQILSNFANDYGDGIKGTDNENRIGPQRALQSGEITPKAMKKAVYITALLSLISAVVLVIYSFGFNRFVHVSIYLILGLAAIVAAIKYTVGNKAYGYFGFGDIFVLIFFGLVSVIAGTYLYTHKLDWTLIFPALSVGLLSVAVLNLNNMRDMDSDKLVQKNTLPVKWGLQKAKKYHVLLLVFPFFFTQAYIFHHLHSLWQWLFMIPYFFLFIHLIRVIKTESARQFDPELKKVAILTFLYALFFGLGMIL